MIERYQSSDDAIPHEATVLVVDDDDTIFDTSYETIFDDVESRLSCDELRLVEHYSSPDELPDFDTLIQYNVWLVKHDNLLLDGASTILSYLCTETFPDETQVVVVVDADDDQLADNIEHEISDDIIILSSRTGVESYLLGYLNTANPCSVAGMEHILAWNNEIADRVGRQRELD